jgi:hypothetical protein
MSIRRLSVNQSTYCVQSVAIKPDWSVDQLAGLVCTAPHSCAIRKAAGLVPHSIGTYAGLDTVEWGAPPSIIQ